MSKRLLIAVSTVATVLVVGVTGYGLTVVARQSAGGDTPQNSANGMRLSNTAQFSDGGGVQVQVTFDPEAPADAKTVTFLVTMNTHSVELGGYDLGQLSQVAIDQGTVLADADWRPQGAASGHHLQGSLSFADPSGSARTAKRITLEIKGLPGPDLRRFEWQVPNR